MNKRYSICGTFSTGKTSVINKLKQKTNNYEIIDEVARDIILENNYKPEEMTDTQLEYFQRLVIAEQIKRESLLSIKEENFFTDAGLIEMLAYAKDLNKEIYDILYIRISEYFQYFPYTKIFYIPIEIDIQDDGVRYLDKNFQKLIDNRINQLFKEFNINPIIITGSVDDRVSKILKNI